jgi:hypothetical protein
MAMQTKPQTLDVVVALALYVDVVASPELSPS